MRQFSFAVSDGAPRDPLTGLLDRHAVFEALRTKGPGIQMGAALVVDLDRFAQINQSLGYRAGDVVLRTIALRLQASLRSTDKVARLGSDDFLILLASPADIHTATEVALRLIESLAEPIHLDGREIAVTACIGVAMHDTSDGSGDDVIRRAAGATANAKAGGAGRMVLANATTNPRPDRLALEVSLRRAFEHRELEVYYQPEFDLRTGDVLGAEALVRWNHPDQGLLAAGSFIDVAEDTGLAARLGTWVLGKAFEEASLWPTRPSRRIVRVNLSAKQLVDDTIVIDVREALALADIEPSQVCLEVTESHLLSELDESIEALNRLKHLGVLLAVDDFGTGFNSMSYLKTLPVDVLKIDKSFVDGVGLDSEDTAIVESIVRLGRMLDLHVVAEGVEHEHQVQALVDMGCHRAQGFFLARPMPASDFYALMLQRDVTSAQ